MDDDTPTTVEDLPRLLKDLATRLDTLESVATSTGDEATLRVVEDMRRRMGEVLDTLLAFRFDEVRREREG